MRLRTLINFHKINYSHNVNYNFKKSDYSYKNVRNIILVLSFIIVISAGVFSHIRQTHADTLPVIDVSGTISSNTEWVSGYVYFVEGQVIVPSGVTLKLDPGVIVKYETGYGDQSITVDSGGTLDAAGTSDNPIVFTSYKDDTEGGDTNGDGSSSGSTGDYGTAIDSESGSTTDVSYATIEYADQGIYVDCSNDGSGTSDSFTNNTIDSPTLISDCAATEVSLQNNLFDVNESGEYGGGPAVTVENADPSGVSLSGDTENTFTGTGQALEVEISDATIASGSTWSVDGTSDAVIMTVENGYDSLTVNGTLNLGPGVIVKAQSPYSNIEVSSGGTLDAAGTSDNPIVFTSYKDDTEVATPTAMAHQVVPPVTTERL